MDVGILPSKGRCEPPGTMQVFPSAGKRTALAAAAALGPGYAAGSGQGD